MKLLLAATLALEFPGEFHDRPRPGGELPDEFAVLDAGCQVHERLAIDRSTFDTLPATTAIRLASLQSASNAFTGPSTRTVGGLHDFGAEFLRHASAHHLARPPPVVENEHRQVVFPGEVQIDAEIAIPALAEPILVRAGFRGECSIAALEDILKLSLSIGPAFHHHASRKAAPSGGAHSIGRVSNRFSSSFQPASSPCNN